MFHTLSMARDVKHYMGYCPGIRLADRSALKAMDTMPCGEADCKRCLVANTMKVCPGCNNPCHSNAKLCACGHEFAVKKRAPKKPSLPRADFPSKLGDVLSDVSRRGGERKGWEQKDMKRGVTEQEERAADKR